jgi:arsenite oxidase small subunit
MNDGRICDVKSCVARRSFLKTGATGVATMLLADVFPGRVHGQDAGQTVQVVSYPRVAVAKLPKLQQDRPTDFLYPKQALHNLCLLVKLGRVAGGGVGEDQDIVAFSSLCTHMGGDLSGGYVAQHKLLGCGEHLSTFDLTRHGILVAGHATESLPQIVLEIEGDTIYATAIVGLLYGYNQNPSAESA